MFYDGTYLYTSSYTDYDEAGVFIGLVEVEAQLQILDIVGTVNGITEEIDWQIEARVRFRAGVALGSCQTSSFMIDVSGDYGATDTFTSSSFTIPALTTGCANSTNRGTINTGLSLGSSGASLQLYKFNLDPVPTGS